MISPNAFQKGQNNKYRRLALRNVMLSGYKQQAEDNANRRARTISEPRSIIILGHHGIVISIDSAERRSFGEFGDLSRKEFTGSVHGIGFGRC